MRPSSVTGPGGVATGGAAGAGVTGNGIPSGVSIPVSAVTALTPSVGPLQVNHQGQQPAVTISFDLRPGVAIGDAIGEINAAMAEMRLPDGITGVFQGTAQAFQSSLRGMGVLLVLVFSKYVYLASISSYYTFYLIEQFHVSVRTAQLCLFAFLAAAADSISTSSFLKSSR